jgi:hypothetical protein
MAAFKISFTFRVNLGWPNHPVLITKNQLPVSTARWQHCLGYCLLLLFHGKLQSSAHPKALRNNKDRFVIFRILDKMCLTNF